MSGLALFELDAPAWVPIYEPRIEDMGWRWPSLEESNTDVPIKPDGSRVTAVEWKAFLGAGRCRDCGVKCSFNQGGGRPGVGSFRVCDDCAQLDSARLVSHTTVVEDRPPHYGWPSQPREVAHCEDCGWWLDAEWPTDDNPRELVPLTGDEVIDLCAEHEKPRWVSHWGESHEVADHDRLVADQARRRAKYQAVGA